MVEINELIIIRQGFIKECFETFKFKCGNILQQNIKLDEDTLIDVVTYHYVSIDKIVHKSLNDKNHPLADHHKIISSMEYSIMLHLPIQLIDGNTEETRRVLNAAFACFLGAYILNQLGTSSISQKDFYSNCPGIFITEHKKYLQNIVEWIVLEYKITITLMSIEPAPSTLTIPLCSRFHRSGMC